MRRTCSIALLAGACINQADPVDTGSEESSAPLIVDPYARNRATGSFILVDEHDNDTVAGGMVIEAS